MSLSGIFPIDKWNFSTHSILNVLTEEEYRFLISAQAEQKYGKGEVVFREGAVPSGIYFIHRGKVKKYKVDHSGREQIIYVANQGEFIGYHAVLSEERYPDSAATIEESVLSFIPKEDFLQVLNNSPLLTSRMLKALSHEYTVLANSISVFSQRSAIERLAIALIFLREKYKQDLNTDGEILINISRNDLANLAGLAKENVIRLLKELKSEDILYTEGRKIWIKNIEKLIARSNYR
ncbi:Crp/Fnr family transcriptional regulator [Pedobacter sp. ISL-68]|uniref:Crp/Fnr family transcriptional regulator n=1 Tax=unclassified Pedobacter TaxID=2628915 RepID=UPI001BE7436F|nr:MULTISPECIES: Crp/Fnr family transcriptional regulator [unclassified Pedobacter]MBT2560663.1 Crp/Fnr family transcriptional regulator [Pedobacter sp. ISL-64]MBT2590042.1 Crp/Fnr family transcriptional regulator [Pedobacter sp. ISL-68]